MAFFPASSGGAGGLTGGNPSPWHGKKKNPWGPDILHNLLDQTEEAAVGLFTAPWYVGKTVLHDAKKLVTGQGTFQSDDLVRNIAKTTWHDVKWRWTPLVHGDLGEFWNRVEEDPLGVGMDVATILTLGGAGVAKAGEAAALAGEEGSALARAAGYTKRAHKATHDPDHISLSDPKPLHIDDDIAARQEKMWRGDGRQHEGELDEETSQLFKAQASFAREDVKRAGGLVDKDGFIWDGPMGILKGGEGETAIPLSRNPVVRARQEGLLKLQNWRDEKFGPGLGGATNRAARVRKREIEHMKRREQGVLTMAAEKAVDALDEREQKVIRQANYHQQGIEHEKLEAHLEHQLARVEADERYIKTQQERYRARKEAAGEAVERDILGGRQARTTAAKEALKQRLAEIREVDPESGMRIWDLAAEQNWDKYSPNIRPAMQALEQVSEATSRFLWEQQGMKLRGKPVDFATYYTLQKGREALHIGDGPGLNDFDGDLVTVEDLLNQVEGKQGKYAHVRPHTPMSSAVQHVRTGYATKAKASQLRRNNFVSFDHAFDMLEPKALLQGARDVVMYKANLAKYNEIRKASKFFATEAEVPKGWTALEPDTLGKYVKTTSDWLKQDAVVIFGNGPELQQVSEVMSGLLDDLKTGSRYAPKTLVDELVGDMRKVNAFVEKYDGATNAWRSAVLSYRPTWVVSNLIGQLTLLLTTHGLLKGTAAWFHAARMGKNHVADLVAPDVLSAGFIHSAWDEAQQWRKVNGDKSLAEAMADASGITGKTGVLTKQAWKGHKALENKILQFNSWLTDDIPRRAAFWAEVKPHAQRILAENPELGSLNRAAEAWLSSSPHVVDKIAQKVMGDLVDFKNLTEFERRYLRRLMPFYSWLRGSTGRTMRMAMDEPWKVWMGIQASEWGQDQLEEDIGAVPDFLKGALTLGDENHEGKRQIITTNSLNPFATLGDVAGMAKSATLGDIQAGGSNPASTFNPFLKAAVEAFTNQDLFYGVPLDQEGDAQRGLLTRFVDQSIGGLPQVRLVQKANESLSSEGTGYNPLYNPKIRDLLLSYFTVPTKELNVGQANIRARAQQEQGGVPLI